MNNYENIKLDKSIYKTGSFASQLEKLDPSKAYTGTELAGLDAFQRQLKRFDIKVSGAGSKAIEKVFDTTHSAALFPEYVSRAVKQGVDDTNILSDIIASKTNINALDYRSITTNYSDADKNIAEVGQGGALGEIEIKLKNTLVNLKKRGRLLTASYEAVRFQRIDLFSVALREIGLFIAKSQLKDAVNVLINGDGAPENIAEKITTAASGSVAYADLINLWSKFDEFEMNTMLVSPDMMIKLLSISELADPATGLNFQATGKLSTPLGAKLIKSSAVPSGTIIGLDKRFALEMVTAGDITVEYDKLIDCQLERAAITSTAGFAKLYNGAVKVLQLKA